MGNNKMIKTAAAVALGASVVATAVAPGAASAATTYKLKSGKLVNAKTGKVVKGYKVYKSTLYKDGKKAKGYVTFGKVLYKNGKKHTGLRSAKYYKAGKVATGTYKGVYYKTGKKFTGLKSGVYYKSGVKGTGSYKSVYYKNGKKHTGLVGATYYKAGKKGTGSYKGIEYKSGKAVNGLSGDTYYKNGVKASGEVDGVQYFDGAVANGTFHSKLYVDGKVFEGTKEGKLYVAGKVFSGVNAADQKVYVDGVLDETVPAITVAGAQKVAYGASIDEASFVTSVKDNSGEEIKAVVTSNKIDTTKPGNYTVTYTATDKNGNVGKASVEVTVQAPAVESVKAINASEIKVDFKQAVSGSATDATNYEFEVNGKKDQIKVDSAVLSADKKSVLLRISEKATSGITSLTEGDKVVVQVNEDVKTAEGTKLDRYASEAFTFTATAKPALVKSTVNSGLLTLVFDRPVNSSVGLIKIDGKDINTTTLTAVSTEAGSYSYTATITDATQIKEVNAVGTHEVTVFNVQDTARTNPSEASTLTSTYTLAANDGIPEVVSVKATNANSFDINFSEAVSLTGTKPLVIKQGNVEYKVVSQAQVDQTNGATEVQAYYQPVAGKANVLRVVIPEALASSNQKFTNPLYIGTATTASLDVTVNNFKDSDDKVGNATTKSVTLSKNASTPVIEELVPTEANGKITALDLVFDKAVAGTINAQDVIVKNADGIVLSDGSVSGKAAQYTVSGTTITITNAVDYDTTFTVTLKKEKVKYEVDMLNVATYNAEATENKETTATVKTKDNGNVKYFVSDLVASTPVKNVFTVSSPTTELDASATDVANYTLDGKALPSGTKIEFLGDKKTVQFTLPEGSIKSDTKFNLEISTKVKTKAGQGIVKDLKSLDAATLAVDLNDNIAPTITSVNYQVASATSTSTQFLVVTFSEDMDASKLVVANKANFEVIVGGSATPATISEIKPVTNAQGKTYQAIIKLDAPASITQGTKVTLVKDTNNKMIITDNASLKNEATVGSTATATTAVVDGTGTVAGAEAAAALTNANTALQDLINTVVITEATSGTLAVADTIKIGNDAIVTIVADNTATLSAGEVKLTDAQALEAALTAATNVITTATTAQDSIDGKTDLQNAINTFKTNVAK